MYAIRSYYVLFDDFPGDGELAVRQMPIRTAAAAAVIDPQDPGTWGKVPRNAPCPCGSGNKYKHCHGKAA